MCLYGLEIKINQPSNKRINTKGGIHNGTVDGVEYFHSAKKTGIHFCEI